MSVMGPHSDLVQAQVCTALFSHSPSPLPLTVMRYMRCQCGATTRRAFRAWSVLQGKRWLRAGSSLMGDATTVLAAGLEVGRVVQRYGGTARLACATCCTSCLASQRTSAQAACASEHCTGEGEVPSTAQVGRHREWVLELCTGRGR